MRRWQRTWTSEQAIQNALQNHPECGHAEVQNGMTPFFQFTHVIKLWRNIDCCIEGDPPRHIEEGYLCAEFYGDHMAVKPDGDAA